MAPSAVNDAGRADEGILARWFADTNGSLVSAGSSNAFTLTPARTVSAYYQGLEFKFEASFGNTGAATLNVSSLGAKSITKWNDVALASGDIESGQIVHVVYEGAADAFKLLSLPGVAPPLLASANTFTTDQTITSTDGGATEGPALDLHRDSASPADNDVIGTVRFKGEDDGSNVTTYFKIVGIIDDVTGGTEDGHGRLDSMVAGTLTSGFHVGVSIYANGNTDPGAGKIDADDLLISGKSVQGGWTHGGAVDLTNSGANDQTAVAILTGMSGANKISIFLDRASHNAANTPITLQLGTGATPTWVTSGYDSDAVLSTVGVTNYTSGFNSSHATVPDAANTPFVQFELTHRGSNIWTGVAWMVNDSGASECTGLGIVTLGAEATAVRITTDNGTATFDNGDGYGSWQ